MNSTGENFEGSATFKGHCDKKDKFYDYKINDSRGNPDLPSFMFKTSSTKAQMASDRKKYGDHFLNEEYCLFDGKHKRCRNFTTLSASLYDPLLKKQIPLAMMKILDVSRCFRTYFRKRFENI